MTDATKFPVMARSKAHLTPPLVGFNAWTMCFHDSSLSRSRESETMTPPGMFAMAHGSVRIASFAIVVHIRAYNTATKVGRKLKRKELLFDTWRKPWFSFESTVTTIHKIARMTEMQIVATRKTPRSDTGSHSGGGLEFLVLERLVDGLPKFSVAPEFETFIFSRPHEYDKKY
jgi:hypothetical protein